MKVTAVFIQLNPEFDPEEYALIGTENDENFKHLWDDEIEVTEDVTELKVANNGKYVLAGSYPDGSAFSFDIEHMTLLNCTTASGLLQFAVSKQLIKRTDKETDADGAVRFTFYIKGKKDYHNPVPGVFIEPGDFPFELD